MCLSSLSLLRPSRLLELRNRRTLEVDTLTLWAEGDLKTGESRGLIPTFPLVHLGHWWGCVNKCKIVAPRPVSVPMLLALSALRMRPPALRLQRTTSAMRTTSLFLDDVVKHVHRRHVHTTPPTPSEPTSDDTTKRLAMNLKMQQILTVPNAITFTRIAFTPYLGHLILQGDHQLALGVLSVAAASDWLDGYLARRLDQKTLVGTFLDPLADKLMVGTLCLSLGYVQLLPLPLVVVIFGRDLLLIGGTLLYRHQTKTAKSDFFQVQNTFEVEPTMTSKVNTAMQFATLGTTLLHAAFPLPGGDLFLHGMLYVLLLLLIGLVDGHTHVVPA
ncbi:Aste57867_16604 [Aphanomyces stellatus]|uniref:Aste57867_16604 protein n=1 Tax=Aphanomyces stellatus TaxID=120398 RepID=A0A485L618_9STRA|nr:hypothetical protein As57867_016547 [Aphanomyces stellatus]VFT93375.1 Aste57867_16604 [Aphanomyces stellatus]